MLINPNKTICIERKPLADLGHELFHLPNI